MTSDKFRLITYYIQNEAYSFVLYQINEFYERCIVSSKEKVYFFEGKKVFTINKRREILDTITTQKVEKYYSQVSTDTEGKIFFLN